MKKFIFFKFQTQNMDRRKHLIIFFSMAHRAGIFSAVLGARNLFLEIAQSPPPEEKLIL